MSGRVGMPAGRELDALVAEKVMGWKVAGASAKPLRFVFMGDSLHPDHVPKFSTDIAAAWDVALKMAEPTLEGHHGYWVEVHNNDPDGWTASIGTHGRAVDPSLPLAICLAALKAVEAK